MPFSCVVNSSSDDPAVKFVDGRLDFRGTESIDLLHNVKDWLRDCVTSDLHDKCSSVDQPLLSRVLDIRSSLKLRETHAETGKYAALSYCWGGDQPNKLILANKSDYLQSTCEASQPKTIRDAVRVCRATGIDSLWVDSYCIIQDSHEDKARELRNMANVYQGSPITIVAASASGVQQGFLSTSTNLELMPLHVHLSDKTMGGIWLQRDIRGSDKGVQTSPLIPKKRDPIDDRAWTLQENVISSRLLHFPSDTTDMQFQCQSMGRHNMTATGDVGGGVNLDLMGNGPPVPTSREGFNPFKKWERYSQATWNVLISDIRHGSCPTHVTNSSHWQELHRFSQLTRFPNTALDSGEKISYLSFMVHNLVW